MASSSLEEDVKPKIKQELQMDTSSSPEDVQKKSRTEVADAESNTMHSGELTLSIREKNINKNTDRFERDGVIFLSTPFCLNRGWFLSRVTRVTLMSNFEPFARRGYVHYLIVVSVTGSVCVTATVTPPTLYRTEK